MGVGYAYLLAAILLETAGTTCMRLAEGFSRPLPAVLMFACYGGCFAMLTLALRSLQMGACYAIWSGLGTCIIAIIGVVAFAEPMSGAKAFALLLIVAGVVGLQLAGVER